MLLLGAAAVVVYAQAATPKQLVPPKVVSPVNGARFRAGTLINFSVRSFPGDHYLWVHISRSPIRNYRESVHHRLCGVIKRDVRLYELLPTSTRTLYRTRTKLYRYQGFWMLTPGIYYWQAYRIEYHHADGCIEAPVQRFVITR